MKLTAEQAEAITRLRNNSDYRKLCEAIEIFGQECTEMAIFCTDETKAAPMRGMARATIEIARSLENAHKLSARMTDKS